MLSDLDSQVKSLLTYLHDVAPETPAPTPTGSLYPSTISPSSSVSLTSPSASSISSLSQIAILPRLLYLLSRSPLLNPILSHVDDTDAQRLTFLRAPIPDALRMVNPVLLSFNSTGTLEELPGETLALQTNRILYTDYHSHIFIWSGRSVSGPAFNIFRDALRQKAMVSSRFRLPAPRVLEFAEGTSQERWLRSRLVPSHHDNEEDMLISFPQLAVMPVQDKTKLLKKLIKTDDLSYVQYLEALEQGRPTR